MTPECERCPMVDTLRGQVEELEAGSKEKDGTIERLRDRELWSEKVIEERDGRVKRLEAEAETRNQELLKLSEECDRLKSNQWDIIQANARADAWKEIADAALDIIREIKAMEEEI